MIESEGENMKAYSLKKETAQLLDCFNRCRDTMQVVVVTGPAGSEKTALIHELHLPIKTQKGFFLVGTFDKQQKGSELTALADALKDFVQQCLDQDEETKEVWKTTVQSSVDAFGQILIDMVPEFENLMGKQLDIAPASPEETVARRNFVFAKLIMDICAVGRPLVMFFDEFQRADSVTLSLLEKITEKRPLNLLIILSCRDNEIPPDHPGISFLDTVNSKNITLSTDIGQRQVKKFKYQLRSKSIKVADSDDKYKGMFQIDENRKPIEYIENEYEDNGDGTIMDNATGLMWQKSGSDEWFGYEKAEEYVKELNRQGFAGYGNWRLPTIPELQSIVTPEVQSNELCIDPVFDSTQEHCVSADKTFGSLVWKVNYIAGDVEWYFIIDDSFVRAVRSV